MLSFISQHAIPAHSARKRDSRYAPTSSEAFIEIPRIQSPINIHIPPRFEIWNHGANRFTRNCRLLMYGPEPNTPDLAPGIYKIDVPWPGAMGNRPLNRLDMNPNKMAIALEAFRDAVVADGATYIKETRLEKIAVVPGYYLGSVHLTRNKLFEDGSGMYAKIDYNCMRQVPETGEWLTKNWLNPITNLDLAGKRVTDPTKASFGTFAHHVGFFLFPNGGLKMNLEVQPARPEDFKKAQELTLIP